MKNVNEKIEFRREFEESSLTSLLSTKVVSAFIGKSISWFNRAAWAGDGIPYTKLGNSRLYKKQDVLNWLEEKGQKVTSTSEYKGV